MIVDPIGTAVFIRLEMKEAFRLVVALRTGGFAIHDPRFGDESNALHELANALKEALSITEEKEIHNGKT